MITALFKSANVVVSVALIVRLSITSRYSLFILSSDPEYLVFPAFFNQENVTRVVLLAVTYLLVKEFLRRAYLRELLKSTSKTHLWVVASRHAD